MLYISGNKNRSTLWAESLPLLLNFLHSEDFSLRYLQLAADFRKYLLRENKRNPDKANYPLHGDGLATDTSPLLKGLSWYRSGYGQLSIKESDSKTL